MMGEIMPTAPLPAGSNIGSNELSGLDWAGISDTFLETISRH